MPRRKNMNDEELENWFFSQKDIEKDNCWKWTGVIANHGYGQLSVKGKRFLTHRFSLQLHLKRIIPSNIEVRHSCNNPACFNPEHLSEGTHKENMNDMVLANRQAKGIYLSKRLNGIEHIKSRGENNNKSKLTEIQVREILTSYPEISKYKLSNLYGVSSTQISRILNGESWKHVIL
jgi:hypothetical protein